MAVRYVEEGMIVVVRETLKKKKDFND